MCNNLVKVAMEAVIVIPYATPGGKTRYRKEWNSWEYLMLRCSHNLTDDERNDGYRKHDEFGRVILCDEHRLD